MAGKTSRKVRGNKTAKHTTTHHTQHSTSSANYREHLSLYWNGQIAETVKAVGDTLAHNPNHPDTFRMYRLWIECLAATRDMKGLATLNEHLLYRTEELDRPTCEGLRGIIHLERDEFSAARILARRCGDALSNIYAQELMQSVAVRKGATVATPLRYLVDAIDDYLTLEQFCRVSLSRRDWSDLEHGMRAGENAFHGSPLSDLFTLHRNSDDPETNVALRAAEKLCERFPKNGEFAFAAGYTAFRRNQFDTAKTHLERAAHLTDSSDPDVTSLLAHTYRELARRDTKDVRGFHDKAVRQLEQATSVLKAGGFPVADTEFRLNVLKRSQEEDSAPVIEELEPSRLWLVKVSPRRYHELCTSRPEDIETLRRPMGATPRPDDLVVFAADHGTYAPDDRRARARSWKIAAIYTVESEPIWHPLHRYESVLRLITLPSVPIAVDVADFSTPDLPKKLSKDHPMHYGVHEIEAGALEIIAEAVALKQGQMAAEYEEAPIRLRMIS